VDVTAQRAIMSTQPSPLDPDQPQPSIPAASVIARTRAWIEKAVIGLNLCPFAHSPYASERVRYAVSEARSADALVTDLTVELRALQAVDAQHCETALLIHPYVLTDFFEYNAFLDVADALIEALAMTGHIQIASFHPRYQFAGSEADAIENYTNRSPYPMLHLLREASVERAVASIADPASIYGKNIETMRRLGHRGWQRLFNPLTGDAGQEEL
jgi:uncharacterized protein